MTRCQLGVVTDAPEHLPADVAAVWIEVVEAVGAQCAGPDLEAYAGQVARLRDAQSRIAAEGAIVADPKGNPIPHPALAIEKSAQAEIRAWGDRFRRRPRR